MTKRRAPRSSSASAGGKRRAPHARDVDIKVEMLRLVNQVARRARVSMGIGGGIAVNVHGYRRETADVDAFFRYEDKQKVLRALRLLAADYRVEPLDESHWIASPPEGSMDERIDFLFAMGDPWESAVETPEKKVYRGVKIPVFSVDWLVVSKFLADRDDPKDMLDIYALWQRGAFDAKAITHRLRLMDEKQAADEFPKFLIRLANLKRGGGES